MPRIRIRPIVERPRNSTRYANVATTLAPETEPITIRLSHADDDPAIARLAALDSAPMPRGALVLAEVDGQLRVAVSTDGRTAIADPFHRTLELVAVVRDYTVRVAAAHQAEPSIETPPLQPDSRAGRFRRRRKPTRRASRHLSPV